MFISIAVTTITMPTRKNKNVAGICASRSVPSLGRDAFHYKHAALRRTLPERRDRLIGGRIVPFACFLSAVESDHHDTFRGVALESLGLATTNNKVMIERCQGFVNPLPVFLNGRDIQYRVHFRNNVSGWRLLLMRTNRVRTNCTGRNPSQYC